MKMYTKRTPIKASKDYADLKGMDFTKARDLLTKDGFYEHEYGDKDNNNGYAVYRKGDQEVELQYRWIPGKRKGDAHAGKVTNVYVDDNIYGAAKGRSVLASAQWDEYTVVVNGKNLGTDEAGSFELAARGVMSWFSYGTIITVSNSRGETKSYEIIKVDDSVRGYSDLRDVTDRLNDTYASTKLRKQRVMASNYNPEGFAVTGYYDSNYRGVAADRYFDPNELDEAASYAHDLLSKGLYVNIIYWRTGDKVDITPDEYFDNFDGDFWCTRDLVEFRDIVQDELADAVWDIQHGDVEASVKWDPVPESRDEETGEDYCYSAMVFPNKTGADRFIWIEKNENGEWNIINHSDDTFNQLATCKSLASAKRWVTMHYGENVESSVYASASNQIPYDMVSTLVILRDYANVEDEDYINNEHKLLVDIADTLYNVGRGMVTNLSGEYKNLYEMYGEDYFDKVLDDVAAIDSQISDQNLNDLIEEYNNKIAAY